MSTKKILKVLLQVQMREPLILEKIFSKKGLGLSDLQIYTIVQDCLKECLNASIGKIKKKGEIGKQIEKSWKKFIDLTKEVKKIPLENFPNYYAEFYEKGTVNYNTQSLGKSKCRKNNFRLWLFSEKRYYHGSL